MEHRHDKHEWDIVFEIRWLDVFRASFGCQLCVLGRKKKKTHCMSVIGIWISNIYLPAVYFCLKDANKPITVAGRDSDSSSHVSKIFL